VVTRGRQAQQQQDGPGNLQQQQQQQDSQQPSDQNEEAFSPEVLAARVADLSATMLRIEEQLETVTAEVTALGRANLQQKQRGQGPSQESLMELEKQWREGLAGMQQQLAGFKEQLDGMHAKLQGAGLQDEEQAKQLQESVNKGAQAYMEQQRLAARLERLEAAASTNTSATPELANRLARAEAQLQAGAGAGEIVVHGPAEWHPETVAQEVAMAGGVTPRAVLYVKLLAERAPAAGARNSNGSGSSGGHGSAHDRGNSDGSGHSNGTASGSGGSSSNGGSRSGAGNAGQAGSSRGAEAQQRGDGSSGRGGAAGAGADTAAGAERRDGATAVWLVRLAEKQLEGTFLGGRCRRVLKERQLPLYVDKALSSEERQQRRLMQPVKHQLRRRRRRRRRRRVSGPPFVL
jgi:hypothetical protein